MSVTRFGLTGGIASGKSFCSRLLAKHGFTIIDADLLTPRAYVEAQSELVRAFGEQIVSQTGAVDRKRLAGAVFGAPAQLAKLNAIMHPIMTSLARHDLDAAIGPVILDAALLFEAHWNDLVQRSVVVLAPTELRIDRMVARDHISVKQAHDRLNAQMSDAQRIQLADALIYNVGTPDNLIPQLERVFDTQF